MLIYQIQPRLETPATPKQITIGAKRLAAMLQTKELTKENVTETITNWMTKFGLKYRVCQTTSQNSVVGYFDYEENKR